MPRLFWKLFLALWVSIMGFVVLSAWINATLSRQDIPEPPDVAFARSIDRAERFVGQALRRGGAEMARARLSELPRAVRNQLYLFDEEGAELLGRDRVRRLLERERTQREERNLTDRFGRAWTLVVLRRAPPGRFLEPGRRGIILRLAVTALFSAFVSFLLARSLARPLEGLGAASRRLAEGDLGARVGAPLDVRRDEFGTLARDLDRMAERLDASQRANLRLLRDVSHELRSPLARQRVALELARNRAGDAAGAELDRIELESERLEALIDQVLSLLRDSSGAGRFAPEAFDLAELLGDLAETVAYEWPPASPGIETDLEAPLPVTADRELLWRAVENLLRNALLHSGAAEPVRLHARRESGGGVTVRVQDRGPGVPEAQLAQLFDPFTRVDEARDRSSGGHGLGLAIAAAAVRRHGGTLTARNRDGGGLELRLTLPPLG